MKKLSKSAKGKIYIIICFLAAIIFCILWLSTKIDINKYIKWNRLYYETHLSSAADSLEKYVSGGDIADWNAAAEDFHAYAVLMTESALRIDRNPNMKGADPFVAKACYSASEAMLINRGETLSHAEEILSALRLLEKDENSPEAAKILEEIAESAPGGAEE